MGEVKKATDSVRPFIDSFLNFIQKKTKATFTSPYDGTILKIHYRWTFYFFLAGFFSVWNKWYHSDVIACVSQYNADVEVRKDYLNICLSYPYIEYSVIQRRYLLFYRWVHWSLLTVAAIYYMPRKVSKGMKNPILFDFLENLVAKNGEERKDLALDYFKANIGTQNAIYFKYVSLNFLVLALDICVLCFYNLVLHNRFISLGVAAFPYDRDPQYFSDYISQTFPPFAWCELSEENQMSSLRAEKFGCHLTMMELYEKVFLLLWYWLWTLIFVTAGYILFLFLMNWQFYQRFILKLPIEKRSKKRPLKVGDIFLLLRIRRYFTKRSYYDLVAKISRGHFEKDVKELEVASAYKEAAGLLPH